ncbi:DsbC family protein, partial [bacterium LRH843]|nr:DsbC family protein [bacterium LRH843]
MINKLGLALLTSAIASMSMASVESVQANLKKNYPNINVQN